MVLMYVKPMQWGSGDNIDVKDCSVVFFLYS